MKLAAVLVWQLLHWIAATGMCGGVVRPVAVVPLWQLEQLVSVAAWSERRPPSWRSRGRAGVTGDAVAAVGRDVTGERRRALRALGALAGVRTVVAGVAAAGADRRCGSSCRS